MEWKFSEQPPHKKVLVLEDSASARQMLIKELQTYGSAFELLEAEDGVSGWQIMQEQQPDLILLDLNLPGMGGEEILERMREHPRLKETRVIVISTSGDATDMHRHHRLGVDGFLVKPFRLSQFHREIQKALELNVLPRNPGAGFFEAPEDGRFF